MSDFEPTNSPEENLGNVPLPEGLLARLKQLAVASDDDLDTALRDVPMPAGLVSNLKEIGLTDRELDVALRRVPVPARIIDNLKAVPVERPQPTQRAWPRYALAASLLLAIGSSIFAVYEGNGWNWLWHNLQPEQRDPEFAVVDPTTTPETIPAADFRINFPPEFQSPNPPVVAHQSPGNGGVELPAATAGADHGNEAKLDAVFGADAWYDRLPELVQVPGLQRHGVTPPLSKSYDLLFASARGVNPWVNPGADPLLRSCVVPLVTRTESYDQLQRLLATGRLPSKDEIRIEELLAAMDFRFPPPENGPVAIRTTGGPAPFAPAGTKLLQIAVQAAPVARREPQPQHFVLALDVSASMRHGGRWDIVRRALLRWARELKPDDALSVIVFRHDAKQLLTAAQGAEIESLAGRLQEIQPTGSTSVGVGLSLAYQTAIKATGPNLPRRHKVVLVTDGLAELNATATERVRAVIDTGIKSGISLDILDLTAQGNSAEVWRDMARAGDGRLLVIQNSQELLTSFRAVVTGRVDAVAKNVKMKVRFDAQAVERYRLIGHDPALLSDWAADHVAVDLRPGEAAVNQIELRLRSAANDKIGEVELTWTDPATGAEKSLQQPLSRQQFAPSYREAPLPIQWGALVAEAGEILRESPHVSGTQRSLEKVVALAGQANPRLRERPEFRSWLAVLQQAVKAKASRN